MRRHTIFFLDIDGTLLDPRYRSNEGRLKAYIQQLEKQGYAFGLNSNRALEDLLPVAEQFGITGPLIGENGLFVYYPDVQKTDLLLDLNDLEKVVKEKVIVEEAILGVLKERFGSRVHWKDVDTVNTLSHGDEKTLYSEGDIIVFNNKFRKYTVSAHIKRYQGEKLLPLTGEDADIIVSRVRDRTPDRAAIVYSPTFGNILMYPDRASKRTAIESLRLDTFSDSTFYAIGDELGDYLMIEGIGTFLTVGNASDAVKRKASKFSKGSFAQGVLELLEGVV